MWTEQAVVALLSSSVKAVERGIVRLYNRQLVARMNQCQETSELNGLGFSGADARLGTYYAKWILSGKHLSGDHLVKARPMKWLKNCLPYIVSRTRTYR